MNRNKEIIIILLIIIAALSVGIAYEILDASNSQNNVENITTNNSTVKNATLQETQPENSDSGKYGHCAICGKSLTYEESTNEYTEGKVCHSCASNPYYQSGAGAEYANQKLAEAYPEEYSWVSEDSGDDSNSYEFEDEYN